ncbi:MULTISPECIES: alpha/beta hydrolase [unclassified Ruminococcus]|uniref:alpha/beta hydrolase n=1 Tax=unclassified Ruminococcus TaxID=2608920 RepID=UPI002108A980|nr:MULTISPECIES: alpha/beta hydrolase [unclassified Ruminococcus]MCQ4022147.1 alpha/beta fold hydrolase [Ruminococcus sp. zg-924]MCQ4114467.1 alpha/beta fold hydrolase [Ruminococcus sp. zg-921]
MNVLFWVLFALISVAVIVIIVLICATVYFYRLTILRKPTATLENNINASTDWSKHLDFIHKRKEWFYAQPMEEVYINSCDGLKLHATLLKNSSPSIKTVICFHGYTSCGKNDYTSLSKFYYEHGFNVLIVDERAHGESEGKYIGFGVLDRNDAKSWVQYIIEQFGNDSIIFLHGTSMGGATVLMATGVDLPSNVKAVVSDCAFTSAYDVFCHILKRDYHIPKFPIMNLTDYLTKKNAGYGYKDVNTIDCVSKTNIPILFIHGDKDDFVPYWMSEKNYAGCSSEKELLIVQGADHAESYYVNTSAYEAALLRFIEKYAH